MHKVNRECQPVIEPGIGAYFFFWGVQDISYGQNYFFNIRNLKKIKCMSI